VVVWYGSWIYKYLRNQCIIITEVHGEVYLMQKYVIKFVSNLRHIGGFLRYSYFLHQKTDRHYIIEILLKVTLNTILPPEMGDYVYPLMGFQLICAILWPFTRWQFLTLLIILFNM